ncbi:hypothetical protein C8Q72DRAFT_597019 [Fomitopsis betulina]|nr:hypothetical protein C8Q72DRAFT_597019 [Fomitopsis betulina]
MVQVEDDSSDDEAQESKAVYDYAAGKLNTVRVLRGNITEAEWERFQYYAGLVRVCVHDYDPMIDPSVYLQLSLRNQYKPLLPNMRYLRWMQRSCTSTELLHIIGPSLRCLEFDFEPSPWNVGRPRRREYTLKALLDDACNRAPNIEELYLEGVHHPDTLAAVQGWKQLRHLLDDAVVEFSALEMLSSPESLNSLWIDIGHFRGLAEVACPSFEKLGTLSIEGDSHSLEGFFGATHLTRLRKLTGFADSRQVPSPLVLETPCHLSGRDDSHSARLHSASVCSQGSRGAGH